MKAIKNTKSVDYTSNIIKRLESLPKKQNIINKLKILNIIEKKKNKKQLKISTERFLEKFEEIQSNENLKSKTPKNLKGNIFGKNNSMSNNQNFPNFNYLNSNTQNNNGEFNSGNNINNKLRIETEICDINSGPDRKIKSTKNINGKKMINKFNNFNCNNNNNNFNHNFNLFLKPKICFNIINNNENNFSNNINGNPHSFRKNGKSISADRKISNSIDFTHASNLKSNIIKGEILKNKIEENHLNNNLNFNNIDENRITESTGNFQKIIEEELANSMIKENMACPLSPQMHKSNMLNKYLENTNKLNNSNNALNVYSFSSNKNNNIFINNNQTNNKIEKTLKNSFKTKAQIMTRNYSQIVKGIVSPKEKTSLLDIFSQNNEKNYTKDKNINKYYKINYNMKTNNTMKNVLNGLENCISDGNKNQNNNYKNDKLKNLKIQIQKIKKNKNNNYLNSISKALLLKQSPKEIDKNHFQMEYIISKSNQINEFNEQKNKNIIFQHNLEVECPSEYNNRFYNGIKTTASVENFHTNENEQYSPMELNQDKLDTNEENIFTDSEEKVVRENSNNKNIYFQEREIIEECHLKNDKNYLNINLRKEGNNCQIVKSLENTKSYTDNFCYDKNRLIDIEDNNINCEDNIFEDVILKDSSQGKNFLEINNKNLNDTNKNLNIPNNFNSTHSNFIQNRNSENQVNNFKRRINSNQFANDKIHYENRFFERFFLEKSDPQNPFMTQKNFGHNKIKAINLVSEDIPNKYKRKKSNNNSNGNTFLNQPVKSKLMNDSIERNKRQKSILEEKTDFLNSKKKSKKNIHEISDIEEDDFSKKESQKEFITPREIIFTSENLKSSVIDFNVSFSNISNNKSELRLNNSKENNKKNNQEENIDCPEELHFFYVKTFQKNKNLNDKFD